MEHLNRKIDTLIETMEKIFLKESTELSFVQGYSDCYTIVLQNFGKQLHNAINNIISNYIRDCVQPIVAEDLCKNRLEVINKKWEDLDTCGRRFHDILLFLDSNYAQPQSLLEVYDMGLHNFRNLIIRDHVVSEAMQNVMFGMIIAERQGDGIDYSAIKSVVNLLIQIGEENNPFSEYDNIFEDKFLENSKFFYKLEAQNLLEINNAITYIETYENRLIEEKERITRYLHKRTETKILELVENILIKENLNKIIHMENGLSWMIQEDRIEELKKIYQLFKKYSQIKEFNDIVGQCFNVYANSILDCVGVEIGLKEKSKMIEDLLNLKLKFENLTYKCFENNEDLKAIFDNMFIVAMNFNKKTSEYLACYIHEKMLKYEKNASDSQIDEELNRFIELFKLVTEKDVFEKYANNNLARRLLSRKANLDIENKFIGKLQVECGNDFIKSLKMMTKDIIVNETHMDVFHNEMITKNVNLPEIDFLMYVLCKPTWPKFQQYPEINLPQAMLNIYELYLQCYNDKHSGRKVTLQYNMGTTQIKAHYEPFEKRNKREYMFEGTTLHAVILDLFNANDTLSVNEIQAKTNIPEESLDIVLTQLVKNKILNIEEKNEGILKIYSINLKFFSKTRKYKIKAYNRIDTSREEDKELQLKILSDRTFEIEAAIVRLMKTRKTLKVTMLEAEVITMLNSRFKPSVQVIKTKIKDLIHREFIAYAKDDTTTIIYID